jgi:hypothetical protein
MTARGRFRQGRYPAKLQRVRRVVPISRTQAANCYSWGSIPTARNWAASRSARCRARSAGFLRPRNEPYAAVCWLLATFR